MREPGDARGPRDLRLVPGDGEDATSVFVIAPYPSLRAGLRALVEQTPGLAVIADAPDDEIDSPDSPAALVVDVDPDHPGLIDRLTTRYPDAALLLLLDSPAGYRQLPATERSTAVLLKDAGASEIGAAIFAALQGLVILDPAIAHELTSQLMPDHPRAGDSDGVDPLTEREHQVLELLALGLPNKTIAMELGISEHTAKFHVGAIMSKLGAASRTEAVAVAARRGLLVL
ncbi:MAG TPA: response regulator transcription factor [Thermomicrobiales bacterium]|nr:response regulator transcription factor [Thermomicrobiales bacterium]